MIGDRGLHVDAVKFCVNVEGVCAEQTGSALWPGTAHLECVPTEPRGRMISATVGHFGGHPGEPYFVKWRFPGENSGLMPKSADEPPEKTGERAGNLVEVREYSEESLCTE